MKRFVRSFVVTLFALWVFGGCEGDRGPVGPAGPPGKDRQTSLKIVIAAADGEANVRESVMRAFETGIFPFGTRIDYINLVDSIPSLQTLLRYDAVLCYTLGVPVDPNAAGDVLADYVDHGGGVFIGQGAFSPAPIGGLAGRIMSEGYSPFRPAPRHIILSNRWIDPNTVEFPFHPIFNRTEIDSIRFLGQPNLSNPELDPTATLLAKDTLGFDAVAINANGNIIAANMVPRFDFGEGLADDFCDSYQLMANAVVFVAGGF